DEECSTSKSEYEEYVMAVKDFEKFFKRRDKNQRAFVGGSWSDSGEEHDEKAKDEACLIAQASNEVCFDSSYFSDEKSSIDDLALDNEYDKLILPNSKAYIILNKHTRKIEKSLNMTFDETPLPSKTSPMVDDDLDEKEAIKVFRNKLDENGIVSRNKARLVTQGYSQQEGIDYDETDALVARLDSIRILLAYAYVLYFKLFQMDVKSAILNGFINEEKQTALAISTTEAKYVSAEKACQQALWMKQALIDYDVRLDDVSIMCDNKGAVESKVTETSLKLFDFNTSSLQERRTASTRHWETATIVRKSA
nr:retrovirus-related Pol polyprotein from transposon TNT 1-94 [Tanacetum cinerariifolium]